MRSTLRGATGLAAGLVCAAVVSLVPGAEAAKPPTTASNDSARTSASMQTAAVAQSPVTNAVRGTFGKSGTVRGTFEPARFIVKKGEIYGVGTLHAVLKKGDGTLVGTATREVTIPLRNATATAKTCS
ncbi:MAG: hypothetical protein H0U51_05810, partial [Propionibacteriales bacterium]|nr:hypothetical protein [Propionibacteriales bacterium]